MQSSSFSKTLLRWGTRHGRNTLPWQKSKTPYRVWVSEIMLQQTQAKTVAPYFLRFLKRFPNLTRLALAQREEVLEYWAGLGYYRRAHNLHRTAQQIVEQHQRRFPRCLQTLIKLPGIGRSTAAAILALCYEQPQAILDGNVQRILARYYNVKGLLGDSQVNKKLWGLSESLVPQNNAGAYTQAFMDLGATVCTPNNPSCSKCPLRKTCQALKLDVVGQRPQKKAPRIKPTRKIYMLMVQHKDMVLLEKRPSQGIWSGLLCLPEFESIVAAKRWGENHWGTQSAVETLPPLKHHLTHLLLSITVLKINITKEKEKTITSRPIAWCKIKNRLAIPTPLNKLLSQLDTS